MNFRIPVPSIVKVLMLKGEKGDKGDGLSVSETPIDNGHQVTITDADGSVSFDLHNATSGDYLGLTNKPTINGNIISGAKTGSDYGLVDMSRIILITGTTPDIGGAYIEVELNAQQLAEYGVTDPDKCVVIGGAYKTHELDEDLWYSVPSSFMTYDGFDGVFPYVIIYNHNNVEWKLRMCFHNWMGANFIDYRLVLMQLDR